MRGCINFTPTKSVSDLYSMHEEEYCNTHYTNSSWRKEGEGLRGGWEGQRRRGGRSRGGGVGGAEGGGMGVAEGEGWEGQRGGRCNTHYTNYMAPVNDQLPTVHSVYISLLPPPTHINTQGDHTHTIRCSTGRGSHVKWLDQSAAALDDTHQCPSHGGSRYLRNRKQVM